MTWSRTNTDRPNHTELPSRPMAGQSAGLERSHHQAGEGVVALTVPKFHTLGSENPVRSQ